MRVIKTSLLAIVVCVVSMTYYAFKGEAVSLGFLMLTGAFGFLVANVIYELLRIVLGGKG